MNSKKRFWSGFICAITMLIFIIDTKTAINSANEGIDLCLRTLIPSLFPLLFLSQIICSATVGQTMRFLRPFGKICSLPTGAEGLLLLGILGGYPVGAQAVAQAFQNKQLQEKDAKRMLGFCSNAGPSFIFGVTTCLFKSGIVPWVLWIIHIASALLTAILLPDKQCSTCKQGSISTMSVSQALNKALHSMALICGWVVLFKIIQGLLFRWFAWALPIPMRCLLTGVLELSNGCISLLALPVESIRFILCSAFLGLGGVCVSLQTLSVVKELGCGMYFPGKILQCMISILLSIACQYLLFPFESCVIVPPIVFILLLCVIILILSLINRKKAVAFHARMMYNKTKLL